MHSIFGTGCRIVHRDQPAVQHSPIGPLPFKRTFIIIRPEIIPLITRSLIEPQSIKLLLSDRCRCPPRNLEFAGS